MQYVVLAPQSGVLGGIALPPPQRAEPARNVPLEPCGGLLERIHGLGGDGETAGMLHEMASRGVAMAVLLAAVWVVMVLVSTAGERATADRAASGEA